MFTKYNQTESREQMKLYVNSFIRKIDNDTFNKIRNSKGDAECRRYLKEQLEKLC